MPKVGDKEFPYTPEGIAAAKAESENMGIPVNDGANRSVTEYAGGGKTGYNMIGMEKPMMMGGGKMMKYEDGGMTPKMKKYEEGGKVSKRRKKLTKAQRDAIKKQEKKDIATGKKASFKKVTKKDLPAKPKFDPSAFKKKKSYELEDALMKGRKENYKNVKHMGQTAEHYGYKKNIDAGTDARLGLKTPVQGAKTPFSDKNPPDWAEKKKGKKMKHGGKIDKNKDIRNKMQLKKNLMSDLKVGDSVYSNKRKPGMSTKMKTGKLSVFEKNEAKRTDKDFNTFKLKKKKKI
jgi:hypothetical protein